jgi:hypothetical protein
LTPPQLWLYVAAIIMTGFGWVATGIDVRGRDTLFELEIYRLVTILEASLALADFEGREPDKRKLEFLRGWEFPEMPRIVVSLAATIRSALDADSSGGGFYREALERQAGTVFPDEPLVSHVHTYPSFASAA